MQTFAYSCEINFLGCFFWRDCYKSRQKIVLIWGSACLIITCLCYIYWEILKPISCLYLWTQSNIWMINICRRYKRRAPLTKDLSDLLVICNILACTLGCLPVYLYESRSGMGVYIFFNCLFPVNDMSFSYMLLYVREYAIYIYMWECISIVDNGYIWPYTFPCRVSFNGCW